MPRRARIAFANIPHHIVQRGHCRKDVFLSDFDRIDYLATLAECREAMQMKIYAYCLMSWRRREERQRNDEASGGAARSQTQSAQFMEWLDLGEPVQVQSH